MANIGVTSLACLNMWFESRQTWALQTMRPRYFTIYEKFASVLEANK